MSNIKDFIEFIRQQGVVGLAIGFVLGGSVNQVVSAFVKDIIQPVIGLLLGSTESLTDFRFYSIAYGHFIAVFIDFLIVAAVVYFIFKGLRLDKLDKPKQK